jgi:HEPN domain-containing protein
MKPETEEWIEKAEGDLKVARREQQAKDSVYDAVCFHAQRRKVYKGILRGR